MIASKFIHLHNKTQARTELVFLRVYTQKVKITFYKASNIEMINDAECNAAFSKN
jgi:hypothetical protein